MAYSGFTDAISRETNHPPVLAFLVPMGCKTTKLLRFYTSMTFFLKARLVWSLFQSTPDKNKLWKVIDFLCLDSSQQHNLCAYSKSV